MYKYYIRTHDNGTHTVMADDIIGAIHIYITETKRSIFSIISVVNAEAEGR